MALNLHLVRVFLEVVEKNGFSRAAESLRVSQPAVSKSVRELESQIGAELLERRTKSIQPTEIGHALVRHARLIAAVARAAEQELDELRGLRAGSLAVGASKTIAAHVLTPHVQAFSDRHPGIELQIVVSNTTEIAAMLLERRIQIALVEGPVDHPDLVMVPWRTDELLVCAARSHPLGGHARIAPEAIADMLFVVREKGSGTREMMLQALDRIGVRPARLLEVGSNEAIAKLVAGGVGLAVLSSTVAEDQIALGRLRVLDVPGFPATRTFSQLRFKKPDASPATLAFEALIHAAPRHGEGRKPAS